MKSKSTLNNGGGGAPGTYCKMGERGPYPLIFLA